MKKFNQQVKVTGETAVPPALAHAGSVPAESP